MNVAGVSVLVVTVVGERVTVAGVEVVVTATEAAAGLVVTVVFVRVAVAGTEVRVGVGVTGGGAHWLVR